MLWTDKIFISLNDLLRFDAEIQSVAESEEINLEGDNGMIRGAIEETSLELQKLMIAYGGYLNSGDLTANHLAAVLNVGIGNSVRQKALLDQVCVSGDTAATFNWIKQWTLFWTLRIFYRNAFARTVNDRYEKKMEFYKQELDRRVTPSVKALGIPIVLRPLYAPGAVFVQSGSWTTDNVGLVAGPGTLDTTNVVNVAITYVDMSQANLYVDQTKKNNAESEASDPITLVMQTGNVIEVDITSLVPPTGQQNPAQVLVCVISPMKATHWNVYVGLTGRPMYLQNSTPIDINTKTYTLPGDPTFSGYQLGVGQYPDRRLSITPTRQRS